MQPPNLTLISSNFDEVFIALWARKGQNGFDLFVSDFHSLALFNWSYTISTTVIIVCMLKTMKIPIL